MLQEKDLTNNLNSIVSFEDFFHAFGYQANDTIYFRSFSDKKTRSDKGRNDSYPLSGIQSALSTLRYRNSTEKRGIYFVVNGGGNSDDEVKASGVPARAQFADMDDMGFLEQIELINSFPLEPSIIIKSVRGLHPYWLLKNGDIHQFRQIQERLAAYFKSDPVIKNESRVMRLYGFNHLKHTPELVRLIKFNPELKYTQEELAEHLPEVTTTKARKEKASPDGIVRYKERYPYLISKAGEYIGRLKDADTETVLALVMDEYTRHCQHIPEDDLEAIRNEWRKNIKGLQRKREAEEKNPDFWAYAVKAWEHEHGGQRFDSKSTSWEEVRNSGERAKASGWEPPPKPVSTLTVPTTKKPLKLHVLKDVQEEETEWLIPEYIPKGQITLLVGDGGTGKTGIWCNIIAGVTTGNKTILEEDIPFPVKRVPQTAMFFSSEDSVSRVLRKRLRLAGADENKIMFVDMSDPAFEHIKFNSEQLAQIIEEYKPAVVLFDPLQSFIPPDIQMGSRNAMRQCLSPLAALGDKYGTAFIIVMHTNKKLNVSGRGRCADSADIWDIARSVMIVGYSAASNTRYLSHEKSNYGALGQTILFDIDDGKPSFVCTSKKRDADFINERPDISPASPARDEAKESILEMLSDHEWHKTSEIEDGVKTMGVSNTTLKRAKKELKDSNQIEYKKEGFPPVWYMKCTQSNLDIHNLILDENSGTF